MSLNILLNTLRKINYSQPVIHNIIDKNLLKSYKLELNNYNNHKYIHNPLIINRIIYINNSITHIIHKNHNKS